MRSPRTRRKPSARHLSKHRTEEALTTLAIDALQYADQMNAKAHELTTLPPMACKSGCAWCCSLQVVVSAPEVFFLADFLRNTRSVEELILLTDELLAQWEHVKDIPVLERLLRGAPCALLGKAEKTCSVYEARPLACRGHTSTDASACEAATKSKDANVTSDQIQFAVYNGIGFGLVQGTVEAGYPPAVYELCGALLYCLKNPDAAVRWAPAWS